MNTEKHICKVCNKPYKLVGKNTKVLANHGFKVDQYGQSRPCRGAGFTPEDSLTGAIRRSEYSIEYDLNQRDRMVEAGGYVSKDAQWHEDRANAESKNLEVLKGKL